MNATEQTAPEPRAAQAAIAYRSPSRLMGVLFYVFTWSLYSRNPYALDGGDNLLYLLAFFLMFTASGMHFSLDGLIAKARGRRVEPGPITSLIHNYAVAAIVAQLCLLYFTSGFYKCQGRFWQNGTAIYYILRSNEFDLSPYAHYFYDGDVTVTLVTWATVFFQIAWPFLIWFRRPRPFVALGAIFLHSMIGYFMGLVWFSAIMITAELAIFSDGDYLRFAEYGRILLRAMQNSRRPDPLLVAVTAVDQAQG